MQEPVRNQLAQLNILLFEHLPRTSDVRRSIHIPVVAVNKESHT